ncbi:hypothetical protein DFH05DRAFT_1544294 [Lentinula detonsa]|uniref:Uncharacterized protein n=1 Tax=Lentinula detonsa TaxID=2804962 RepID=A0A9W8TWQ9_9AGAR|nr:hypothetical protein DFH05DRAFT_1544294 [Lentinula detonsa]
MANDLLAQASVDSSALSQSIAHLNASTTFSSSSLQPLPDTGNLISTIEHGRKETQESFYCLLEDRTARDWEKKKAEIIRETGLCTSGFQSYNIYHVVSGINNENVELNDEETGPGLRTSLTSNTQQNDRTVVALNSARLGGTSYPIIHALTDGANDNNQTTFMFTFLVKITQEPLSLPPLEHGSAHILNSPCF